MEDKGIFGWVILAILCVLFPPLLVLGLLGLVALAFSSAFKRDGVPYDDEYY